MPRNPYEPPQTSATPRSLPSATPRGRALLLGLLIGATICTVGVFLLVVVMIGVALLTEPDEWKPGGGANIGAGLLYLATLLNLPTAAAWIAWWFVRSRSRANH